MKNILVVEDDAVSRDVLSVFLKKNKYNPISLDRGNNVLETLKTRDFSLILLDVNLPDIDGFSLCKLLKENPETRYIPIIFLTALASPQDIEKGFEYGGMDYVTKPFDFIELKARIKSAINLDELAKKIYLQKIEIESIVKQSPSGIVVMDNSGKITIWNQSAEDITGYRESEVKNKLFQDIASMIFLSEVELPSEIQSGEATVKRKDNTSIPVLRNCQTLKNNQGNVMGYIEVITDMTKVKELESYKMRLEKERKLFERDAMSFFNWKEMYRAKDSKIIEDMMYSLNNSVNSIGGPMLLDFLLQNVKQDSHGNYVFDQGMYNILVELKSKLSPLFNNLGNIETIIGNAAELEQYSLDKVNNMIDGIIRNQQNNSRVKNNQVQVFDIKFNMPDFQIKINKELFTEVISELLVNAIKYSPANENIWVELSVSGDRFLLKITNTSPVYTLAGETVTGIPYEYSEIIYHPFERLIRSVYTEYEEKWQYGLGLFVVNQLVNKMEGKITCKNGINSMNYQDIKPITTFTVELPLAIVKRQ